MKYRVEVHAIAYAEVMVEAESTEEAREKAFQTDFQWSDHDGYELDVVEVPDLPTG